ncbi:MAG: M15 family metallopeptidase [Aquabacterium sp.]|nr:M15 family metallopeptidase [Aquabacterium sp.]
MHTGWVVLYFLLGIGALALGMFPHWRVALRMRLSVLWRGGFRQGRQLGQNVQRHQTMLVDGANHKAAALQVWWRSQWMWVGLTLVLLVLPVALVVVWSLTGKRALDGFDDATTVGNQQLTHLLQGEQLVPPPPLPPEVFATAEVEVIRPMLSTADRRWEQMDPDFVQRLLAVFKVMKDEHGYDMTLLEGYRSPERQAALAAKGSSVTMAGAWQSYHQYGLAADCAFYRQGKLLISEKDPWAMRGYQLYGQVAQQMGLTWGGHWQMMDLGHIELPKPSARAAVRAASYR